MPFDDTNYREPQMEPPPRGPRLSKREESIILAVIVVALMVALLLPISAGSLVDIAAAIGGRRP